MAQLRTWFARATSGPTYPPDDRDIRDIGLAGLAFPLRASVAIVATTALILVDQLYWLLPPEPGIFGSSDPPGLTDVTVARFVLFLVAPAAIVLFGFRDELARYGLRLGNWRWGAGLLVVGLVVMTPIIIGLAGLPQFRDYYGAPAPRQLGTVVLNHLVELIPAEFLMRGFVMFALWRRIGPLALVVSLVPFVLTHLGKPEIELWSTFIGGSVFAWLNWRTGSILWSALGHVYVLTLMELAVGGATLG